MTPLLARFVASILLICSAALSAACDKAPSGNTTATPGATHRIAVLSPAAAITLRDLGLAPLVVARHSYDVVLDGGVLVAGDITGIDYEALIAAQPTHVVIQWGSRDLPARMLELSTSQHWAMLRYDPLSLRDVADATSALRETFADAIDAARAKDIDARFAKLLDPARTPQPRRRIGTILLIAQTNPIHVLGPGSWHHELLERAGGIPSISQGLPWIKLDAEDMAAMGPGGLILILPRPRGAPARPPRNFAREFDPAEIARLVEAFGTLPIPALRQGRVAIIDEPTALMPSTALLDVADRMGAILDAWEAEAK